MQILFFPEKFREKVSADTGCIVKVTGKLHLQATHQFKNLQPPDGGYRNRKTPIQITQAEAVQPGEKRIFQSGDAA